LRVKDPAAFAAALKRAESFKPATKGFTITTNKTINSTHISNQSLPKNSTTNLPGILTKSALLKTSPGIQGLTMNQAGGWFPPDVSVAVGPYYLAETVNNEGEIWKKGGQVVETFALGPFFLSNGDYISDPRIVFDTISDRWFASLLDITTNGVKVAVSTTNDPTGTWNVYNFQFDDCPDQPIIGISDDKFVISSNDFANHCNGGFTGAQYIIVDKQNLLSGVAQPLLQKSKQDTSNFSIHPVHSLSSTSTLFMVTHQWGGGNSITLFSLSGSVPNAITSTSSLTVQAIHQPPLAHQPGTSYKLDVSDGRILDAFWYQNKLWLTFGDSCVPAGDTLPRSCFRLDEIDTITNTVLQDFDVNALGDYMLYPSMRTDYDGNLRIIAGESSDITYPSLLVMTQLNSTRGVINDVATLLDGSTAEIDCSLSGLTCRYGDYFGAAIDPSSKFFVWVAGQYYTANPLQWSTFIADVYPNLNVVDVSSNANNAYPSISASGSNVYVAWQDAANELLYARSIDGGNTFGNAIVISTTPAAYPSITASGSNVYLAWQGLPPPGTAGGNSILFRTSHDGGSSFGGTQIMRESIYNAFNPKVVASGNNVWVTWKDDYARQVGFNFSAFLVRASSDGGDSFGPISDVGFPYSDPDGSIMAIAASGSTAYLSWVASGPSSTSHTNAEAIMFRTVTNNGALSNIMQISDDGQKGNPFIATSASDVYVAWVDLTSGVQNLLFRASHDSGATFGNAQNLANNPWADANPKIAISGAKVFVVWGDYSAPGSYFDFNIFMRTSTDSGSTFGNAIDVTNNPNGAVYPEIAVTDNSIDIVSSQNLASYPSFSSSTDGGFSFSENLNFVKAGAPPPHIAAFGNKVYAVWWDMNGVFVVTLP